MKTWLGIGISLFNVLLLLIGATAGICEQQPKGMETLAAQMRSRWLAAIQELEEKDRENVVLIDINSNYEYSEKDGTFLCFPASIS